MGARPTSSKADPARSTAPADWRQSALQLALDVPQMEPYWHIDTHPERVPLRVAPHPALSPALGLVKFGRPVSIEDGAPLRFETIALETPERARVVYRFELEGVRAEIGLRHDGRAWTVAEVHIVER